MTGHIPVSLQAFLTVDKDKDSIQYLISRVNQQRGSFRHLTEQSLLEEIKAQDAGNEGDIEQDTADKVEDGAEDLKSKREEISAAREQILKQIAQAHNESAQALDFISLLLSKHNPAQAQITISQFIKQTIPLGSLGAEVVQAPPVSAVEKRNREMVSMGWRMQSLNGAADSILKSASRLEEEMEKEATYWNQVLAVKEKGWSLSRLPREKHTLGIRYGFAEAHADFRDRGLAALRRDADGNISLDRGIRSKGDRRLRVRILRDGKPITSTIQGESIALEDESVERLIFKARDSIYDEELHHEIYREARNLTHQEVRCMNGKVLLPYEADKQIEIDLVSDDDVLSDPPQADNNTVMAILISLRILLSYAHRQNLHRRSQVPPPLREHTPPRPTYAILRPIIERIQHQTHVQSLQAFLHGTRKTLSFAGLDLQIESRPSSLHAPTPTANNPSKITTLLQTLTSPLHTTTKIYLLSPPTSTLPNLVIETYTSILPPHNGTSYTLTPIPDNNRTPSHRSRPPTQTTPVPPPPTIYTTLPPLTQQILHHLALSLQHRLLSRFPSWRAVAAYSSSMVRKRAGGVVKDAVTISITQRKLSLGWKGNGGGGGGVWRWYGGEGDGDGVVLGEKRSFEHVFGVEVDGGG